MLYKLTDQKMQTYNGFQWELGETYSLPPVDNPKLCSTNVFHVYKNLNLAFLLNPSHSNIHNPRAFLADGEIVVTDFGKAGVFELRLLEELETPNWVHGSLQHDIHIMFAVLCAESVLHIYEDQYHDDRPRKAIKVAREYLRKKPHVTRTAQVAAAAREAANAAYAAADAAATAATAAADAAAAAAADAAAAAYVVSYVAYATNAANSTDAYAFAASHAAYAAADAALAASYYTIEIDFGKLAELAVSTVEAGANYD